MAENKKQSFLYNFLISPKFRLVRHILIIFALSVLAFNQTYFQYKQNVTALGYWLYLLSFVTWIMYLAAGYFNLLVLIPRFLLKKKYLKYIVYMCLSVSLPVLVKFLQEYIVYSYIELPFKRTAFINYVVVLDGISYFVINAFCISAISITMLLKNWMNDNRLINQLEQKRLKTEIEQLKYQINSDFLFNILNRTGVLATTEPEKASKMLMKLSQLLRYELYDCNRDRVLLTAEINFIRNYLELEKIYSDRFEYNVTVEGDINRIFVSPLLFVPFIEHAIKRVSDSNKMISISLSGGSNSLVFNCTLGNAVFVDSDFREAKHRLDLLYGNNYTLSVLPDNISLNLKTI